MTSRPVDHPPSQPRFGHLLRRRRRKLGLTQRQAGLCVGASLERFRHWESGKGRPGPAYLPAVLLFLGPLSPVNRRI